MSGIDAPQPWHATDPKQDPPPNGTRTPCPLCGCAPGELHIHVASGAWRAPRPGTPATYGPGDCDPED